MAVSVNLPALGESVTEGTVTRWLKQEGDTVEADEPLLEISTDKVDTEIPSPASGTLLSIKVREDETVEVGAELAVIGDPSEGDGGGGSSDSGDWDQSSEADDDAGEEPADEPSEQPTIETPAEEQPATDQPAADEPAAKSDESKSAGGSSGSSVSVVLPALGESVTEGTVTRWLKQEGDTVEADEPLLEISTDKVDTEIPSPASGTLLSIKVREDETVDVGAELAVIGSSDAAGSDGGGSTGATSDDDNSVGATEPAKEEQPSESAPADEPAAPEAEPPAQKSEPKDESKSTPDAAPPQAAASTDQAAYVTPLVRKLASEQGVNLSAISGTGVGGRIRKQDVLEAARASAAAPPAPAAETPAEKQPAASAAQAPTARPSEPASQLRGRTEKLTRLRATIAKRMVESLQVSAQLTTVVEVDVTRIARLRARAKADFEAREGVKLSYLPFFAKAICESLKVYPQLNASIDQDAGEVTYHAAEHLGIAVDTERGLLVATIKDAGDLNIGGLARKIADLATRTRANKVSPDELSGGTFTLTNTGSRGALFDTPIIMQPQVGILGTGAVVKRPVVIDDADLGETIAVRSMVYMALTYDHRLVDGADAARFLTAVKARLEEGAFESDLGL